MSDVSVKDLLADVVFTLQDPDHVRWSQAELVGYLNKGYLEIVNQRPDANSASAEFTCVAGTRQILNGAGFEDAFRLIDVVRNISSGRSVRKFDRKVLDTQRRNWHGETQTLKIQGFCYDPRLPREFHVYPPAKAGALVEIVYSRAPGSHDTATDYLGGDGSQKILLTDNYSNALMYYVLHRCYMKDADFAANASRSAGYWQAMQSAIGVKTQADTAFSPTNNAGSAPAQ